MELIWVILILQAFICGFLAMAVAEQKGHSTGVWFASGFFLGIFGLIAAAGLPNKNTSISIYGLQKKCPDCAESIHIEALVCKDCRKEFSKEQVISELANILEDESIKDSLRALDILRSIKSTSAIPRLIKLIQTITIQAQYGPNFDLLNKTIQVLSELGSPAISPDIVSIVKETESMIKATKLIELLGSLRDPSSIPILVDSLMKDELRLVASGAIEKHGESALPYLERLAKDGKRANRRIAEEIIRQIKSKSSK